VGWSKGTSENGGFNFPTPKNSWVFPKFLQIFPLRLEVKVSKLLATHKNPKGSFQRTNDGDRRTSSVFPNFKFCSGALFFNINRPVFRERRSQLVVRYLFVACFPKELPWKVINN